MVVVAWSLDRPVGPQHQRRGDRQAQCFSGLEVDHQLVFGGLLDGKVGRLAALQDLYDIADTRTHVVCIINSVGNETTALWVSAPPHNWQPVLRRELYDTGHVAGGQRVRYDEKAMGPGVKDC